MSTDSARTSARVKAPVAITAAAALAIGGALVAAPGFAQTLRVDDAVFDWQVNAESGGAAPLPGTCHFLVAGEMGNTGGTSGFDETFYAAKDGATRIVKPDAAGVDHLATWDDKCLDPNGDRTTTSASSTSGNRVQISGGTGTVDPVTDTGTLQWEGSWTFVYYSGMTYWSVSDPRLEVEDGKGRIVGTFTGYGAAMDDPSVWEELPPVEGTIADLTDATVDLTEDGFTVTPDYLGVETDVGDAGFTQLRSGEHWGAFPQEWIDFNVRTGQSAFWFSSGGSFDPKKPVEPITVSYTAEDIELAAPAGATASDVTTDSARVSWDPVDGADGYEVRVRAAGGDWRDAEVDGTSAGITGLTDGTDHTARVRAVAGEVASPWSTVAFRTADAVRAEASHEVVGASASHGLSVRVIGSNLTQELLPANSEGVEPSRTSSIGMGLVPAGTPAEQVDSSSALGYSASLLMMLQDGAIDTTLTVPAAELDLESDYDLVVWNATQGGHAGSGATIHRGTVPLTDAQQDELFDGETAAVPPIDDLSADQVGDTFLTLRWTSDSAYTTEVRWRKATADGFATRDVITTSGWGTSTRVAGLERGTDYVFEVKRKPFTDSAEWSEVRQYSFTTLESVPQPGVPEPAVDEVSTDSIDLSWEPTEHAVDYAVSWGEPGSGSTRSNSSRGETSFRVTGLSPDTTYEIGVRGVSDLKVESERAALTVTTESVEPTGEPTEDPTDEPTDEPTEEPTGEPTEVPTDEPTDEPAEASERTTSHAVDVADADSGLGVTVEGEGYVDLPEASSGRPAAGVYVGIVDQSIDSLDVTGGNVAIAEPVFVGQIADGAFAKAVTAEAASLDADADYDAIVWSAHGYVTEENLLYRAPIELTDEQRDSLFPSEEPSEEPSEDPSAEPTEEPSREPTDDPSEVPSSEPTVEPSDAPGEEPTEEPTGEPSQVPTAEPTADPSAAPSAKPSEEPSGDPSGEASQDPSDEQPDAPSEEPSDASDPDDASDRGASDDSTGDGSERGDGSGDNGESGTGGGSLPRTGGGLGALLVGLGAIAVGVGALTVARRRRA